jgi:hypothetical protein
VTPLACVYLKVILEAQINLITFQGGTKY